MRPAEQSWKAADYALNASAQSEWAAELIGKLELQGNESLLDIGCGNGAITARLAALLPEGRVVGIDSYPQELHPHLSFIRMDAADIRLACEFDVAFSNATLHWVADQVAVLRGVRSCLHRGGRIMFQMGGRGNAAGILRTVESLTVRAPWRGYFEGFVSPYYFHGPEEYKGWLPACGFEAVRVELIPKDMRHRGLGGLKGWLRTTWFPYTDRLPPELRDRFLDAIVDSYAADVPLDSEGCTHVAMVRLEVEARAPVIGRAGGTRLRSSRAPLGIGARACSPESISMESERTAG
jgi:trans-aconitate methyltransferase